MDLYALTSRLPLPRLRTSATELEGAPCSRCYELHTISQSCGHIQKTPETPPGASSTTFYTAYSYPSISSLLQSPASSNDGSSSPTGSSASSLKLQSSKNSLPSAPPPILRRKVSPTETSLREIRAKQQRLLQMKHSEDQLRQLYERQTMEYLYGDFASLDGLRE